MRDDDEPEYVFRLARVIAWRQSVSRSESAKESKQMSENTEDKQAPQMRFEECVAGRQVERLKIDSETAEVAMFWVPMYDPYGVFQGLPEGWPEDLKQVEKTLFARMPASNWIRFQDLPAATAKALKKKINNGAYNKAGASCTFDEFSEVAVALKVVRRSLEVLEKELADLADSGRWLRVVPNTSLKMHHPNEE
jgi:hypothetical protein